MTIPWPETLARRSVVTGGNLGQGNGVSACEVSDAHARTVPVFRVGGGAAAAVALSLAGCALFASAPAPGLPRRSPLPSASPARAASASPLYPVAVPRRQLLPRRLLAAGWRPAPGQPWSHRLLLAGMFTDVVPAGDVLYLLETLPHRAEPMQLLVRADMRTGTVRYARRLVPVSGAAPGGPR